TSPQAQGGGVVGMGEEDLLGQSQWPPQTFLGCRHRVGEPVVGRLDEREGSRGSNEFSHSLLPLNQGPAAFRRAVVGGDRLTGARRVALPPLLPSNQGPAAFRRAVVGGDRLTGARRAALPPIPPSNQGPAAFRRAVVGGDRLTGARRAALPP